MVVLNIHIAILSKKSLKCVKNAFLSENKPIFRRVFTRCTNFSKESAYQEIECRFFCVSAETKNVSCYEGTKNVSCPGAMREKQNCFSRLAPYSTADATAQ